MSPEMLKDTQGLSRSANWWTLGILTFEMIAGFPPYYTGKSDNAKMFNLIQTKQVSFPDSQRHKIDISNDCKDFITKLLDKDP